MLDLDWSDKGLKPQAVFVAFCKLPHEESSQLEALFQEVHAMATDGGIQALIDEATFHKDSAFTEEISPIVGHYNKVIWVLLNKPKYLRGARMFLRSDRITPHLRLFVFLIEKRAL